MYANIKIDGLEKTEAAAREILEHVDAIKRAAMKLGLSPVALTVELKENAASGN